jgi:hypothetical protein
LALASNWIGDAQIAEACAPAPPHGHEVAIDAEEALIVYDAKSQREHFIRRGVFSTTAASFGFLVPTPTRPALSDVDDALFAKLADKVRPRIEYVTKNRVYPSACVGMFLGLRGAAKSADGATVTAPVRVLDSQRVAGLDAVVLEADDATALGNWLADHGFGFRDELKDWLRHYVDAKWKITAFKMGDGKSDPPEQKKAARELGSKAVVMSFSTPRAFYPYREPTDQRRAEHRNRSLRVFFIGATSVVGKIGESRTWPGSRRYSAPFSDGAQWLAGTPAAADLPANAWLTSFDDYSSPRPGVDEVYFRAVDLSEPMLPDAIVIVDHRDLWIPVDLLVAAAGGVWLVMRRRAQKKPA